jgi:rhomboid protease GlpG
MRAIGVVSTEQDARRLGSYLLTLGIASQIDPAANGYYVWIRDEDKVDRARAELDSFLANPANPRYDQALPSAEQIHAQQIRAEQEYRRNVRDVRTQWRRPMPQNCRLTVALIAACVGVAVVSRMGDQFEPVLNQLFITRISKQAEIPWMPGLPEIRHGQVWRLITPILIHFGPMHLIFNLWNFYSLAGVFEMVRGSWRLAVFIIFTAIVSNMVQYLSTGYPVFGGMSGVLYALFGYIWMKSQFDPSAGLYLHRDTVTLMIVWLFICMTGRVGPIANGAHVGGLIVGMVVGIAPVLWRRFVS